ncbi:MAG TPA: glutathione S-transferase family protein [Bdellovibrionota bacterium]|jgi:putative glutathione S-transferase|nr:glutathione S-transferase family protein [Bdellovibrionota bacterium]
MGYLEHGKWMVGDVVPKAASNGEFLRHESSFRETIDNKNSVHKPESGRYHLYVSYACPWATRTLIMRKLKQLEEVVSLSLVSPNLGDHGWSFLADFAGVTADNLMGKNYLYQIYTEASPTYTGKVTVPVLFDTKLKTIVNNESSEIVRIFNSAFDELTGNRDDYYPVELRQEIDKVNAFVYENINNGVYKAGFAQTQAAYDKNVKGLFDALDKIEERLKGKSYLVGERLTEADVRLFVTLVRFDSVYYGHFKCNHKMIREYPDLHRYLNALYQRKPFRESTHFNHIKQHYYYSQPSINPYRIVPIGPERLI